MRITKHLVVTFLLAMLVLLNLTEVAQAHVGSPDVFLESNAGPYHVFVFVRVPLVIPAIATVDVRSSSIDVERVSTTVLPIGVSSKYSPVADIAQTVGAEKHIFRSTVWLMESGAVGVKVIVDGKRGRGELLVPVAAVQLLTRPMPRGLGVALLAMALVLALGLVLIIGAAARESTHASNTVLTAKDRARAIAAMTIAILFEAVVLYQGGRWWTAVANEHEKKVAQYRAPKIEATTRSGNSLILSSANRQGLGSGEMGSLLLDHGHLMHLFLIRGPEMDCIWHLHPTQGTDGQFYDNLPRIAGGHYRIFADVVEESGVPVTFVGSIDLPSVGRGPLEGDDSGGIVPGITKSLGSEYLLPGGGRIVWQKSPIVRGDPMSLKFSVLDQAGNPDSELQPYMGMAAHAQIVRSDFGVFAHIHPYGSVPMASLMLVSSKSLLGDAAPRNDPAMAGMMMPESTIAPNITLHYGFPSAGDYRIFLEIKHRNVVETAVFDTHVP